MIHIGRKNKIGKLYKKYGPPYKLHIGCGTDYKEGWINIDNNSDNNIEILDLSWDMTNPLPFEDNSIDFIFNEHFIEHLTVQESRNAIYDFMRVLRPGGVLRIATLDLKSEVNDYLTLPLNKNPVIKTFNLEFIKTRAELLNMAFSWWGHRWLYDEEELERRLKEAVCRKFERCKLKKSRHLELRNLETREESNLIIEVTK